MALTEVGFRIAGDAQYVRAFQLYEREAADMSDPLGQIGGQLIDIVGDQFLTEGGRSAKWAPLNTAYDRWKDSTFGAGRPTLVASGDMRAAALDRARALRVTAQRLLYTVHDDKAIHHQQGHGHLPARKLVSLTATDRRGFDREFVEWANHLRRGVLRPGPGR